MKEFDHYGENWTLDNDSFFCPDYLFVKSSERIFYFILVCLFIIKKKS